MTRALEVADAFSNKEERIVHAAEVLGKSEPRKSVFNAIYHHKKKIKLVSEVCAATDMPRMRVLQEANTLSKNQIINTVHIGRELAYEKIGFYDVNKKRILRAAGNGKLRRSIPTKRNLRATVSVRTVAGKVHSGRLITIDDIKSFAKVRDTRRTGSISKDISEEKFKHGIQKIVGQPGTFKDWGGESSDLFTTRLVISKKRVAAAFAFKGPGLKSRLYIANMGKRGGQAIRLFKEPAEIFIVQHWREIDPAVIDLLGKLADSTAARRRKDICYAVIDGIDSARLVRAYRSFFK